MIEAPNGRPCEMGDSDEAYCDGTAIGHVHLQAEGEPERILWVCRSHFDWLITAAHEHEFKGGEGK